MMSTRRWMGYTALLITIGVQAAAANPVLAPWSQQATGWIATLTSVWVPIIFTCVIIALLVSSRYVGDQDSWISSMLSVLVKASLAGNALSIVSFFVGLGGGVGGAATLEEMDMVIHVLEVW